MDIGALVTSLAVGLSPYAVKGVEKIAQKVAEEVYDKAKATLSAIRTRLRGKPQAEAALDRFEAEPSQPESQAALAEVLRQEVATQPEFEPELLRLAQALVAAMQSANERGAKYQVVADQIIGQGDYNTFNFYGAPPKPES